MATFKTGTLASPIRPVKAEPDLVLEAQLAWQGPFEHVFAKVTQVNKRSIEAVCAWIAQQVDLPTPAPRFLRMHRSRIPKGFPWPFADQSEVMIFGTVAVEGAAPLSRADSSIVAAKLDKWPFLELSAVFDQLISNDDRTQGNILLAPRGDLWLIDHARSLGGGGQRLFSSETLPLVKNFFLDRIAGYALPERIKRKPILIAACLRLSSVVPRIPYEGLLVPPDISVQIDHFLTQRASRLQAMVLDAVGLPDMYDHGTQPRGTQ